MFQTSVILEPIFPEIRIDVNNAVETKQSVSKIESKDSTNSILLDIKSRDSSLENYGEKPEALNQSLEDERPTTPTKTENNPDLAKSNTDQFIKDESEKG